MNRQFFACVLMALSTAALGAQQSSQQNPYQGTSNPPANDAIVTDEEKPAPGKPMEAAPAPASQYQMQTAQQPSSAHPSMSSPAPASEMNPIPLHPSLAPRYSTSDPDGDIVHPAALRPGEIGEGATIRVRLLDRLSTAQSEKGEQFRSTVTSDVLQAGQVVIPAGTEIDGTVVSVSMGHVGASGSIRLRPDYVVLTDGTRYQLHADTTGIAGTSNHIGGEGTIKPDSRWKRNSIEYGGVVGGGAITGAVMGGPVGALAGGLIGAGVVTTHLLVNHPQATLEPGTVLMFTLTESLQMAPVYSNGN